MERFIEVIECVAMLAGIVGAHRLLYIWKNSINTGIVKDKQYVPAGPYDILHFGSQSGHMSMSGYGWHGEQYLVKIKKGIRSSWKQVTRKQYNVISIGDYINV